MKLGYADPPYPGCADLYRDHPDYAGEVDHAELIARLERDYAGWVLHTNATPETMALLAPLLRDTGARWCSWRKGFAAFKKNVPVAYAWEPVIIKAACDARLDRHRHSGVDHAQARTDRRKARGGLSLGV